MAYKWCVAYRCKNTSINYPEKIFLSVPKNTVKRRKWLQVAGRDPNMSIRTHVYMCEDHFNMQEDVTNYMKYKMGFSKNILLANGVVPSKFDCQKVRKEAAKREREEIVKKCLEADMHVKVQPNEYPDSDENSMTGQFIMDIKVEAYEFTEPDKYLTPRRREFNDTNIHVESDEYPDANKQQNDKCFLDDSEKSNSHIE